MQKVLVILIMGILLAIGCSSNTANPVVDNDQVEQPQPDLTAQVLVEDYFNGNEVENIVIKLTKDFSVDYSVRTSQWNVPIYQQRAWLGWWFADYYSDLFGNSLFGKQFMMCYLYYYAIFKGDNQYYFGAKELFNDPVAFNDYQIFALVMALEDMGFVPFYPIEEPDC